MDWDKYGQFCFFKEVKKKWMVEVFEFKQITNRIFFKEVKKKWGVEVFELKYMTNRNCHAPNPSKSQARDNSHTLINFTPQKCVRPSKQLNNYPQRKLH